MARARPVGWLIGTGIFVLLFMLATAIAGGFDAVPWCLGLLSVGTLVGFLFAVPRVAFEPATSLPASTAGQVRPTHTINGNLEEISDWLTKTLVGLGLVELKNVPTYIGRLATRVSWSLTATPAASGSVALAIAFGAPTIGLFFGYIATRLFIQRDIADADTAVLETDRRLLDVQVRQSTIAVMMGSVGAGPGSTKTPPSANAGAVDTGLTALATDYLDVKEPDRARRLAAKNDLVGRMVAYVTNAGISRAALVAGATNEGILIALAAVIHVYPSPGDATLLLSVARNATRLHVKYRIVLALGALHDRDMIDPTQAKSSLAILDMYKKGADASLAKLIASSRPLFESAAA
jgi:hypothetical protein